MAFYFGPASISVDPEAATGGVIQSAANAMLLPGTRVAKNGRLYLYVLAGDAATTIPTAGALLYIDAQATWGAGTNYVVTNGADAALVSSNYILAAGMQHILLTKTDFGFIQIKGDSFIKLQVDSTEVPGSRLVSNLANAGTPGQAILATTTNIVLTNTVGFATSTGSANLIQANLDVEGV